MTWDQFLELDKKYLNLGARGDKHPRPKYKNYTCVQLPVGFQNKMMDPDTGKIKFHAKYKERQEGNINHKNNEELVWDDPFGIYHDIQDPFPIPDNSVDRVHSEDCFEHVEASHYPAIFTEIFRILKKGGLFRLGVPDYLNPKDRFCLEEGFDPRFLAHVTLTTYELLKPYCENDPWERVDYLHYWENEDSFIKNKIDYSKGWIKRTPDNRDETCTSLVIDLIK